VICLHGHASYSVMLECSRCILDLLGAILHVQHSGCNVHQTIIKLFTRCYSFHPYHMAGVYEQLCEPCHLYHI